MVAIGRFAYEILPRKRLYTHLAAEFRLILLDDFTTEICNLENLLERDLSIWKSPSMTNNHKIPFVD